MEGRSRVGYRLTHIFGTESDGGGELGEEVGLRLESFIIRFLLLVWTAHDDLLGLLFFLLLQLLTLSLVIVLIHLSHLWGNVIGGSGAGIFFFGGLDFRAFSP